jgi:hypothetical protein
MAFLAAIAVPAGAGSLVDLAVLGAELISLDIVAVDAAGNRTTQNNRISRTQTLSGRRG